MAQVLQVRRMQRRCEGLLLACVQGTDGSADRATSEEGGVAIATNTPNINLRKPAGSDLVNVTTDLAENFDKIDEAIDQDRDSLAAHLADVNGTHGYPAPGDLALASHTHSGVELDDHSHPELEPAGTVVTHNSDTTGVHGIANTANLALVGHTHDNEHDHDGDYEPLGSAQTTVDAAIADIIANAPATLDTLNEIAAALGDDPNLATTLSTQIAEKADADHTHGEIGTHNHNAAYEALGSVATHSADTTAVHGIADTALLLTIAAHAAIDHDDIPGSGDVAVGTDAPASPDVGDLWIDSDEESAPGGGGVSIPQQDDEPDDPAEGDLWIDTDAAPSGTSVLSPDNTPASPNAADYEFGATSTSLPSGWSWVNQGSATYNEALGIGAADMPAGASDEARSIVRAIPAAGSFTTIVKMYHLAAGASVWVGRFVVLRDSATGKEMRFSLATPNDATECVVDYYTNPTTFNARRGAAVNPIGWGPGASALAYMKVVKNSATSWDWYLSHDGVGWLPIHTGINVSTDLTPDQIGVGVNMRARRTILSVHHFRVT